MLGRVWLAPLLITLAAAAAGIVAFGNDDRWIHQPHGLTMILLSRRLLWPLVTLAMLLCVALIGLVIANRRSAWWLIGLLPVVALFGRHFGQRPSTFILDNPTFVAADDTQVILRDDDWIVGLVINDHAFALPYKMLATTPMVFVTEHEKRVLLMFCGTGNRAIAVGIARELKARDLEIVATPGGVPLLYDSRLGQFIVAETGETIERKRPQGFGSSIGTEKTLWSNWRKTHADTRVLLSYAAPAAPTAPTAEAPRIALIAATQPVAIDEERIATTPINFKAGSQCLLTFRDSSGRLRVFDRTVGKDLFPKFSSKINHKLPDAALVDSDSNSAWTIDGKAIAGTLKGAKLKELPVEIDLNWPTLKFWQPGLTLSDTAEH